MPERFLTIKPTPLIRMAIFIQVKLSKSGFLYPSDLGSGFRFVRLRKTITLISLIIGYATMAVINRKSMLRVLTPYVGRCSEARAQAGLRRNLHVIMRGKVL